MIIFIYSYILYSILYIIYYILYIICILLQRGGDNYIYICIIRSTTPICILPFFQYLFPPASLSTNHLTQLKTFSLQDGDRVYVIASSLPEVVVAIKRALKFSWWFCFLLSEWGAFFGLTKSIHQGQIWERWLVSRLLFSMSCCFFWDGWITHGFRLVFSSSFRILAKKSGFWEFCFWRNWGGARCEMSSVAMDHLQFEDNRTELQTWCVSCLCIPRFSLDQSKLDREEKKS